MQDRVAQNSWTDARISFVLAAARAVLDPERRNRADLQEAPRFSVGGGPGVPVGDVSVGMLAAYLESFVENASHTLALALALDAARDRMSHSGRRLLAEVPELLAAMDGPRRLAVRMTRMTDPFLELTRSGLRNPHGPGFIERAHAVMSALVRPELSSRDRGRLVHQLAPSPWPGRPDHRRGTGDPGAHAPLVNAAPSDQLRSHLVETLIEMYGIPASGPAGSGRGLTRRICGSSTAG